MTICSRSMNSLICTTTRWYDYLTSTVLKSESIRRREADQCCSHRNLPARPGTDVAG